MAQVQLRKLLEKFFTSNITKTQFDDLKNMTNNLSDSDLSDGLECAWNTTDYSNSMPIFAKQRIREELEQKIYKEKVRQFAVKFMKVAAAVSIPILLASTIYLFADRRAILNQQADLLNISVSKGERATVNLPDGSTVTLNSDSKLYYPSNFNSKDRWIRLEGEGFFQVKKCHGRSFTVRTNKMDVSVLGTAFNVSAYVDAPTTSVVLVHGSVRATAKGEAGVLIKPNQKFEVENRSGNVKISEVDTYNYTCWRDGILNFESEPIVDVLDKLSKQFDVKIEYSSKAFENDRLTGKLDLNDGIENALRVVSLTSPLKFVKHKNTIVITPLH
ncbi:FecR family protein [Alistipes sp. ZOR0009]|uniref:FecR family protein n=1 Tax=Alistipes sp. ZOR0009 TaxID=1339253 RepID=UPI00068F844F|nr:FecR domain-containing protein [Alistipes sp. ZOR0009]